MYNNKGNKFKRQLRRYDIISPIQPLPNIDTVRQGLPVLAG